MWCLQKKAKTFTLHSVLHHSWGFGAESRASDEGSDACEFMGGGGCPDVFSLSVVCDLLA